MTLKINRLPFTRKGFQFHIKISASRFVLSLALVLISLFPDSAVSYKQAGIPESFTKELKTGDLSYVCCAKRNGTIVFRWGLYLEGSHRDPFPLFSRALIKGRTPLENTWSRDFNASRYKDRVEVTYNPKSLCMTWKIFRVTKGDDNTFFGVYRDEPGLGKQFRPCATAMKMVVMETVPSLYTSSTPTPLKLHTQPTTEESHVTTKIVTDDDMEDTSDPSETSAEEPNHLLDWTIPCAIVALFLLVVGIAGSRYKNKIRRWFDSTTFKDRAINAQEMARKSLKRIRRRRIPFQDQGSPDM